ncbi:hypothetical protein RND81_08G077500 [Saponaria officinalis]|uniref:Uncharacterized protein n=1 Tax=Saponaria officinalis TaxID=3572 RepID=A0AAW1J4T4_SAPOF
MNINDDERPIRRNNKNVLATITCTILIGLEVENFISNNLNYEGFNSIASEMTLETKLHNKNNNKQIKIARWSDKRLCPPWHINSLETIVPENLPRPSFAKRKWEGVSYSTIRSAPSIKSMVNSGTNCFTM